MFRLMVSALASVLLIAGTVSAKEENTWHEYTSKNFRLITNAERVLARETIVKLEKYRFTLGQITGLNLDDDGAPPLTLFAFSKTREFQKAMDMENVLGFYMDQLGGPVSALSLEPRDEFWEHDGLETIFHEYNHHILWRYSGMSYPKWYSEGFAEYTSTIVFDGDIAIVGKPVASRFMILRRSGDWYELKDLMRVKSELGKNWKRPHWSIQVYAQGWLLTHFLHHSEKYKGVLKDYLVALNSNGLSEKEAFEKVFGDRRYEFDLEVRQYWLGRELPYFAYDFSGIMPEVDIVERRLTPEEAEIVPLEARILTSRINLKRRQKRVAADLRRAIDAGIRPGDLYYYLALQAYANEDWSSALDAVEKSLAAEPQSSRGLSFKANIVWQLSKTDGTFDDMLPEIRALYARAIRNNSRYVPALMDYARLALTDGQQVSGQTLKVAKAARMLAPRNERTHMLEVRLMERAGEYASAKARLQHLIEWASTADGYKDYQKQYDRILEKETAAASAR